MASLLGSTAKGENKFDKYVASNPLFKKIDFVIDGKDPAPFYIRKAGSHVELKMLEPGSAFMFDSKKLETVKIGNKRIQCASVRHDSRLGFIPLSNVQAPTGVNPTAHEDNAIESLNSQFETIGYPIQIKLGKNLHPNICFAVGVTTEIKRLKGYKYLPKCDFILCEDKDNPFRGKPIFLSHKKDGGPSAFRQYGGLSKTGSPQLHVLDEVQSFLRQAVGHTKNGALTVPVTADIKSDDIKLMSLYGNEYFGPFSLQHVHAIAQGHPKLFKNSGETHVLQFSNGIHVSGELTGFAPGYEPVLLVYPPEESFEVDGVRYRGRAVVVPRAFLKSRTNLVTLNSKGL